MSFGPGAVITGTNIAWTVPYGTSVTSLAPTYTVSPLATGSPVSGTSRSFTSPQTYTVTAEDNSTQDYSVTVTVAPPAPTVTALNVTTLATGAEILNTGTLVEANHFYGNNAPVTLANGLTFGTNWSHTSPAGWSGGQNTNSDAYGVVPLLTDATPFGVLMRNYTWSGSETDTLTIPGLTPGHTYRLQLISVAGKGATVTVEGSMTTTWTDTFNGTPSVLTVSWIQGAGDTELNVTLTRNHSFSGAHDNELAANGYALHDITPPKLATSFSNLTLSQTILGGTGSVTLGGTISAAGPVYPANGALVHVAIDGVTHDATISGGAGGFSLVFPTSSLPISATPYTITYTYDGSSTLLGATDANTSLTVSAQSVPTITSWPTGTAITYGQALTGSSLSGGGASVPGTFSFTDNSTIPGAAGTYHASGTFTPNNTALYAIVVTPGAVAVPVNQVTLTLGSAAVTTKPYDSTNTATIIGSLNGVLGSDLGQVSLVGTGTFASATPGTNIAVTAACTLSGTKAANYTLTQPGGLTGNITQAVLTVKADNIDRPFGVTNPTLTYTISGYQDSDNASSVGLTGTPVLTTDALTASPEGSYTITCAAGDVAITNPNYSLAFANGLLRVVGLTTWAAGNGVWDIETTNNWSSVALGSIPYVDGAAVLFDDTPGGAGPFTVILTTTVHPSGVTFNNPTKDYIISGAGIGGTGSLTKQGAGALTISNVNSYSGGTQVLAGTLNPHGNGSGAVRSYFGTGTVTMAAGTTLHPTDENGQPIHISNNFHLGGGMVNVLIPLAGSGDPWLSGIISGPGGLSISGGTRTLNLGGLNTYSGNTVINDNNILHLLSGAQLTFVIGAASGVNNSISGTGTATLDGNFVIDTTAAAALYSGTWTLENVTSLTGPYGATFSVVGFTDAGNDTWTKTDGAKIWTFVETTGVLTLTAASDYGVWASEYPGFNDTDPTHDPDGDGMTNQQEYAFGLDPTKGASNNPVTVPLDKTTGTFSYTRRATPATTNLVYRVWTSTDLVSPWVEDVAADQHVDSTSAGVETVTVTLSELPKPLAATKLFMRVTAE